VDQRRGCGRRRRQRRRDEPPERTDHQQGQRDCRGPMVWSATAQDTRRGAL